MCLEGLSSLFVMGAMACKEVLGTQGPMDFYCENGNHEFEPK